MNIASLITILAVISEAVTLTERLRDIAFRASQGEDITEAELDEARDESQKEVDNWNEKV